MVQLRGTATEIAEAVKGIAPEYPAHIIPGLEPGEWHFILNGVDTKVEIVAEEAQA